jgi:hypothetical protein
MKTTFDLTLFDDAETHKKLTMLNQLEAMFDHSKNTLPPEYFWFSDELPVGSKVRFTFEVIE